MGTQFSSRLSDSDSRRLRKAIREATGGFVSGVPSTKAGDAVLSQVVALAAGRDFFQKFNQSRLFSDVLGWLKELRSDAQYNEFRNKIKEYGLDEAGSPTAKLRTVLREMTTETPDKANDAFRVAIHKAAVSVLASAAAGAAQQGTEAERLGKQLSQLTVNDLVKRYVSVFVQDFVQAMIHRGDPKFGAETQQALNHADKAATKVARLVLERVVTRGGLADNKLIQQALSDELRRYAGQESTAVER